jgi:predicted NBD/HSP70 family sugar kinase
VVLIYTSSDIRKLNSQRIIKVVAENGPISKVEIAEKAGLTPVTVNTIVNKLIKKGIIVNEGIADSSGGRKASLYALKANAFYSVGINIGIDYLAIIVSNLRRVRIYTEIIHLNELMAPESCINLICKKLNSFLQAENIPKAKLLGIGLTLPGLVDVKSGRIMVLPNIPGWEDIDLKLKLEVEFQTHVIIEKDIYGSLLYLKNQKIFNGLNVVFLTIKGGIGMALLLDGKPYKGQNGIAGEIGHVAVREDGVRCKCGNFGCLELYASDYAIINKVRESVLKTKSQLTDEQLKNIDLDYVIKLYREGDAVCREVLLEASKYVGIMLSNMIKIYDPQCIVINCKWIKEVHEALAIIEDTIEKRNALINIKAEITVIYQEDIYLEGAVSLIFEHVLESVTANPLIE